MLLVLCVVVAIIAVWILLVVSSCLSIRWTRRTPDRRPALRLVMALVPALLGLLLANFHLYCQFNDLHVNLSWPFLVPMVIGIVGVVCWIRARRGRGTVA
jgi:hypothetical protein